MKFKILYVRDFGIYVVEYNKEYYLVNLGANMRTLKYKHVDAILKFGYFEPFKGNLSDDDKKEIAKRLVEE